MNFESLSKELIEKKYYDYAYRLVRNTDDAKDLVSDAVLQIYKNVEYFKRAKTSGYFTQAVMRCILNLVRDRARRQNKSLGLLEETSKQFSQSEIKALEKLKEDEGTNDYHKILFRKVVEFGGATNLSRETGISVNTINTGLRKYKQDLMSVKKILLITRENNTGVGYHRILKPYAELKESGANILITRSNAYVNRGHDIVIFNRLCGVNYEQERAIMNEAKICGQKVIVDIDDYWILPQGHLLENFYAKNQISKRIAQNIREADVVTCTNEVLALKILKLNKNVVVIPNAIKDTDVQWSDHHIPDDTYRFGFVGSRAHTNDVPILRKGCNLMNRSNLDFKFIYVGWSPNDHASTLFEEVFTSRGTGNRYGKIESKPVEEYGMSYNLIDCSLAPLEDNLFNRCKSNLKILEAAAHSKPIICSKIHPYFGSDFDNVVYYAESEYDWYKRMSKLVSNPQEGKERGKEMNHILKEMYTYKTINKLRQDLL